MLIRKKLFILKIEYQHNAAAPLRFTTFDDILGKSKLWMDIETCQKHGIPPSLNLLRKYFTCILESREIPFKGDFIPYQILAEATDEDDLRIDSLWKADTTYMHYKGTVKERTKPSYGVTLTSTHDIIGSNPHRFPQWYRLQLGLKPHEYQGLRRLKPGTVFKVKFRYNNPKSGLLPGSILPFVDLDAGRPR